MSSVLDAVSLALETARRYERATRVQVSVVQEVTELAVYTVEEDRPELRPILYVAASPAGGYSVTVHRGPDDARAMYENDARRAGDSGEFQPVQFVDVMRGDEYDPADFEEVQ